jgi:hypothetical protein
MENQQQEEQLTAEQLEARRLEMKSFYESSIPYLESQAKYEKLLTDVEESRYKRATMQLQYANMMATQHEMEQEDLEVEVESTAKKAPAADKKLKRN